MSKSVTPRQRQVLGFVAESLRARGGPPTLRELGEALGISSTNGVNDHLRFLAKKGCITREFGKSRALLVTQRGYAELAPVVVTASPQARAAELARTCVAYLEVADELGELPELVRRVAAALSRPT